MSTRIRIERLVLDGVELSRRERDALGPAIARELRQLAGEPADHRNPLRPPGAGSAVDRIAREVAAAVHRATAQRPAAPGAARAAGRASASRGGRR
jgi:hypothetical protein